jgi:phosphoribosylamine-glycine ligase
MQGLVIGNNRHLTKQMMVAFEIPTSGFQFIRRAGTALTKILLLIVKLNGRRRGINNNAVKETFEDAQKQVDTLINTYKVPIVVERFIDGAEINVMFRRRETQTRLHGREGFQVQAGRQARLYQPRKLRRRKFLEV